ncbi:protein of unknown function DUF1847 [Syntrophobotulus glycolicus DSM 8271]|uniref:Metal-binding protein n=1 Tax=Syntrophobotulus glycolicus (strain DSM 8271 / FlGlyR) TaxID=645991 RepID=F0SWF4_SYNGF|nr:DUF1847 domain-containing protein [Syntrophobotulus glycolicus]ADY55720.1 protein of unknown function DUF1847 [Syntrophobotulus glycolicus DSM 8271]
MSKETKSLSCSECGVVNCYRMEKKFPEFCLTTNTDHKLIQETKELYQKDEFVSKLAHAAAEIEGTYFGKITRVEEIVLFAKRIGAKKIGIATCVGLMNEAKIFARILQAKGLESYCVICKVSATDKTEIGIDKNLKIKKDCHESLCNPVLQAKLLNQENTDLNVIVGLCVGHDSIFMKYSEAPVTTLITKDRVLAHNPAGALYTTGFYYTRLLETDKDE